MENQLKNEMLNRFSDCAAFYSLYYILLKTVNNPFKITVRIDC